MSASLKRRADHDDALIEELAYCFDDPLRFVLWAYPWAEVGSALEREDGPDDWQKAVEVDNAVEQWKKLGITEQEVFVSRSLIRLRDLPAMNFGDGKDDIPEEMHCNSGVCFV